MTVPGRHPIRVLLVGPSLDILGGQAVQVQRLLARLKQSPGLEARFLPVNPRLPRPLRWLQRIKYVRTLATSLAYIASLPAAVWRSDVIHAFSAGYWSFLLAPVPAMAMGRALGRGVVLNYRTGEAEDHLARHGRMVRPLLRLAHAIVVPSGFLVEVFGRHGHLATPIANVVDLDRLPWQERTALRPRFLSNRNLEPLYNVADVLRAFARIQAALPDAALTVVGHGSERARLEALRDRLGLRQVTFVGAVPPEAMATHYDAHDVYLNAPTIDNMPTSVVEAFACGLPVVTSDAGGIPYLVRHEVNGLMVPQGDPEALAGAALRLFREPGLGARLAVAARREVEERYIWPAVRPAWEALYARVSGRAA